MHRASQKCAVNKSRRWFKKQRMANKIMKPSNDNANGNGRAGEKMKKKKKVAQIKTKREVNAERRGER